MTKPTLAAYRALQKKRAGASHKNAVLSLLDRETGQVRSFHVATATVDEVAPIVRANISKEAHLMTDQAKIYQKLGAEFRSTIPSTIRRTSTSVTGTK